MTSSDPNARRKAARAVRDEAAQAQYLDANPLHPDNGDEARYPNRIGSSTKGLAHDPHTGEVLPGAYDALIAALQSGSFDDFQAMAENGHLGCSDPARRRRFVNPQSAYAYDLEGIDSYQLVEPPPPAFSSAEEAAEMVELYWMALLRDMRFTEYETDLRAQQAANDLSGLSDFRGPKRGDVVTPATLFRNDYPGCLTGPYISQFLLQPIDFGAQRLDTRVTARPPGLDFVTTFDEWLGIINGCQPPDPPATKALPRVYCHNGRAIAEYVHRDVLFQAYLVACVNMLDNGYRADRGNPYGQFLDLSGTGRPLPLGMTGAKADIGFATFGAPWIAGFVCEVATRALKHQWFQKWLVHRRLRPEEFGGHVEVQRLKRARYPFHPDLFSSAVLAEIETNYSGTHLLPQAFPEGSPVHTAYGSGHATVAGACVTVLKWFFDETDHVKNPVIPDPDDPSELIPYAGPPGEPPLTVGGELNKLASNISQARNHAGVHWRTDGSGANRLGEGVAISMLEELGSLTTEPYDGFTLTRFDGTEITV